MPETITPISEQQPATIERPSSPHAHYSDRLETRQAECRRFESYDSRIATLRGVVFLVLLATLYSALIADTLPAVAPVVAGALFVAAVILHAVVIRHLERSRRAVAYHRAALARLDRRWDAFGATGERYADEDHLYTGDLDVFGRRSLFQLLSVARTRIGEDTLAAWLASPADAETIARRQQAVVELEPRTELREEVALLSAEVRDDLDQNQLREWARLQPQPLSGRVRAIAVVVALCALAAIVGWAAGVVRLSLVLLIVLGEFLFLATLKRRIQATAAGIDKTGSGLAILAQVLAHVEARNFACNELHELQKQLETEGRPPSAHIRRLNGLIGYLDNALRNQFFAPFALILCLPVHLVHAVETWRERYAPAIGQWLDAVGRFEALSSLANYAFEHPDDVVPEILAEGPSFEAAGLGHPLIAETERVRNDVRVGRDPALVMVSGSNMSGKSTLLRTVGVNVVLALAGGTVCARALRLSPLSVATSMRVHDSLQEGESLFYAVVSRLKSVINETSGPLPVLFLLDEILQGTNSHDRRIGAEGIIRQLLECGAVGFVTTHDLALTRIVDSLERPAVNCHFEDQIVEGRMTFDYKIRPGVVTRTNALELMRMVGLEVPDAPHGADHNNVSATE